MHHGKLAFVLFLTMALPTRQVVTPQRDVNAEENVATNFRKLREQAKLDSVKRIEGSAFAYAACESARHGRSDKISVDGTDYSAMIFSTADPEDTEVVAGLATRSLKSDDRMVVGVCYASTPAFPAGRYWVAVGIANGSNDKQVAQLLGARPEQRRE